MLYWIYKTITPEQGRVCITVRAKDKKTAIRKAKAKLKAMKCTAGLLWDCRVTGL